MKLKKRAGRNYINKTFFTDGGIKMSTTAYSRKTFYRMARKETTEQLETYARIAGQEKHHCIYCFYCVAKEVLEERKDMECLKEIYVK